jgi:hypothetical protein
MLIYPTPQILKHVSFILLMNISHCLSFMSSVTKPFQWICWKMIWAILSRKKLMGDFWLDCLAMGCDRQTVLNLAGTGTTIFSGGLFRHPNIFGWIVWRKPMGGDRHTVSNLVGTGTTKFSGGLFWGVNSYFGGLVPQYFWLVCLAMGCDGQTVFDFGGNWHYKIFGRIVLRSKLIYFGGLTPQYFGWIVWRWVVTDRLFLTLAGTGTTIFSGRLFRGVKSYILGDWHHNILGWIVWRETMVFVLPVGELFDEQLSTKIIWHFHNDILMDYNSNLLAIFIPQ